MTAPLNPPPHHQPAHGTVQTPAPGGAVRFTPYQSPYQEDGPGMKSEVRQAVVLAVAAAVAGALLGLLWLWLAPRIPLVADRQAVYLKDSEGEQAIGVDGTFALLGLGFGLLSAAVVFLVRRLGGIPLVVGLAVGGLLGSVLAWKTGEWLGPTQNVAAHARQVGPGVTFEAPLELKAYGALLAWPIAAMVGHLGLTALWGPRDPEPDPFPYHPRPAGGGGQFPQHGGPADPARAPRVNLTKDHPEPPGDRGDAA
ncbi:hypothetical protein [Streptomyces sp. NPDC058045]|uniref:hypothetical protein n=1 Tax=Streptomyces sp. NPDC058045 TaxID=3346311 RepID=UPI0036E4F9AF